MKKKIGLTGSTGSLGKTLRKLNKNCSFIFFKGNISNKRDVLNWIKKNDITAIIHLAAIVPIKKVNQNKKKAQKINFIGTKNLVDAVLYRNKIEWFFFASTSHVYNSSKKKISENFRTKPISFYGKTKLLAEKYIEKKFKNTKIKYCIGRIFSTANKNQKKNYLVPDLIQKLKYAKNKIILKNLNHYRDFINMEILSKIIFVLYQKKYNGIINLGSGKSIYLKDIAKYINRKYQKKLYFIDNKRPTTLVANNSRLKKIIRFKLPKGIQKIIF